MSMGKKTRSGRKNREKINVLPLKDCLIALANRKPPKAAFSPKELILTTKSALINQMGMVVLSDALTWGVKLKPIRN